MFNWTKVGAVLSVIGALLAAGWAYIRGRTAEAKDQIDEAKQEGQQAVAKAANIAKVSAEVHNTTVAEASAAKENIHAQAEADRAVIGRTDDDGLRAGADAVAAAVNRANGGV